MENLYELTDFNPIGENKKKTQIILSDTKRDYKNYEKKWRGHFFWDKYEDKQIVSLTMLIKELCTKFKIPNECLGHNVRQDGVENFKGIVTRSNYDSYYKDVNPAFDFKLLKELLEND